MKKSIFDLNYKEGKKIIKELRKSSYCKQYLLSCLLCIVAFFILSAILPFIVTDDVIINIVMPISLLMFGFFSILTMFIFGIKQLDLTKKYYDEKYLNKKDE